MRFLLAALVAVVLCTLVPVVRPPAATAQGEPPAQLDVTKITPSVVAGDSPGEVTISGRLTNTSDQVISGIQARVQRGNPTTTEPATQRAMRGDTPTVTGPAFSTVADRLAPGQQVSFDLHIPLTGANSLQISQPGSYPLLVNFNGTPGSGSRARIAEARFLLPVVATPGSAPVRPGQPVPTSMVVPIIDYPRMEREAIPGMPTVLIDDQLSASLAPGGRLYELVEAVTERAGPGSPLGSSLCFAVDPDLLLTVEAMRKGYLVRQPNGSLAEGIGGGAAELWLNKLKEATSGRCVLALPYADADLVALGRAGLPDVIRNALYGTEYVHQILDVEPRRALWPIEGALDEPAAGQLGDVETVLLEPQSLGIPAGSLSPVRVRGHDLTAVPIDPLLTSALDPLHDTPQKVTALSPPQNGSLSAENALAALVFRATQGFVANATSVLVPPRRWNMRADDLRSLLDGMQKLADAGYLRPTALPGPDPATLPEADLTYPVAAGSDEIPQPVIDELAAQNFAVGDLYRSSREEPSSTVEKGQVTTPLANGLLHGVSSAWRGNPGGARYWVSKAANAIDEVLSKVRVEEFPGQVTRSSADSPIPVTVVNDLPIAVGVMFHIPPVPGVEMQLDFGGLAFIPANGRRQFPLQTNAQRAGTFTIDVSLTTEGGTPLGTTKRMQVESTNYGELIPWLTGVAAVLLVLMSGRRIVKRALARRQRTRQSEQPVAEAGAVNAAAVETPESAHTPTTEGDRDGELRS
ncbi:glycoprotein [Saccharopolyspora subtropica]|uniref:Glycoprotein n=1 Tax=Saccharopolyspora thermophila TaxID=89367 RepID=A0A917NAY3_9PSEU|nr:DUF6049 family protein [Saccharopolyspora subtropica]GGI82901.1 glycoprotein [Saccharopolyspora subtropica]